ncbi:hypothetical protein B0H16DRAFT_1889468 [Mycena metata]|uniref:Uncharacterized protein n=1 Tax=Mycena metata TaxID=1033252 RepID=A0AAD7IKB9_9AGAR|nr:hypothetical protein B0H16DRAFT_1889468 [Mycena metata]
MLEVETDVGDASWWEGKRLSDQIGPPSLSSRRHQAFATNVRADAPTFLRYAPAVSSLQYGNGAADGLPGKVHKSLPHESSEDVHTFSSSRSSYLTYLLTLLCVNSLLMLAPRYPHCLCCVPTPSLRSPPRFRAVFSVSSGITRRICPPPYSAELLARRCLSLVLGYHALRRLRCSAAFLSLYPFNSAPLSRMAGDSTSLTSTHAVLDLLRVGTALEPGQETRPAPSRNSPHVAYESNLAPIKPYVRRPIQPRLANVLSPTALAK